MVEAGEKERMEYDGGERGVWYKKSSPTFSFGPTKQDGKDFGCFLLEDRFAKLLCEKVLVNQVGSSSPHVWIYGYLMHGEKV